MHFKNEPTFEHLQSKLQSLQGSSANIIPLIIEIENYLDPKLDVSFIYKTLKQHTLTLKSLCHEQSESDRLGILKDYFFNQIEFQVIEQNGYGKLPHWKIYQILVDHRSTEFLSRQLFLYLAEQLEVKLYPVHHHSNCLVGWMTSSEDIYLNLNLQAKRLSEQEIIHCFNQRNYDPNKPCLESLSSLEMLKIYISQMMIFYNKFNSPKDYLKLLNLFLTLDKNHLHSLSERALVYKELGQSNKAYNDLKRYMSFTDINNTPKPIKLAYYELQAIHKERVDLLLRQEPKTFH